MIKEICEKCDTHIASVMVHHPIHDGPFSLSGNGQVYSKTVKYCPSCDKKPSSIGAPLKKDPVEVNEMEILRRIRNRRNGGQ